MGAPSGGEEGRLDGLSVTLSTVSGPEPIAPGDEIVYVVVVSNLGPGNAGGVVLSLQLPPVTTLEGLEVPEGWGCWTPAVQGAGEVLCAPEVAAGGGVREVAEGERVSFRLVARVGAEALPGTIVSKAAQVSGEGSVVGPNGRAELTLVVGGAAGERATPAPAGALPRMLLPRTGGGTGGQAGTGWRPSCVSRTACK